jgi:hypothetical protein
MQQCKASVVPPPFLIRFSRRMCPRETVMAKEWLMDARFTVACKETDAIQRQFVASLALLFGNAF